MQVNIFIIYDKRNKIIRNKTIRVQITIDPPPRNAYIYFHNSFNHYRLVDYPTILIPGNQRCSKRSYPPSLCIMENHRLQPSPSVSSSFLLRPMPLSFLHIFCSGFPLLSEINNNTAVTNPLFSTALVKSRSENSLSKTIPSVALTSKVSRHMISGNWLSLIRPNSFIIVSARKKVIAMEARRGDRVSTFLSFPLPSSFPHRSRTRKRKKKFEISPGKWTIVSCSRFFELEGKVDREGESFSLWYEHPSSEGWREG